MHKYCTYLELYVADGRQHQVSRAERAKESNFPALLSWGYQHEPLQSLIQFERYRMRQVISRVDGYHFSCWMVERRGEILLRRVFVLRQGDFEALRGRRGLTFRDQEGHVGKK